MVSVTNTEGNECPLVFITKYRPTINLNLQMQHNEHGVIANEILQSIAGSFNLEKVGTIFSPLLWDVFSAYSLLSLSLDKAMLFRNFPWSDM